jgi:hypothetical protein
MRIPLFCCVFIREVPMTAKNGKSDGISSKGRLPFSLRSDGTAHYANYAVCNASCSPQALKKSTLNETFTSDVYVLFSVPAATQPVQLAYTGAVPPIVMSST